MTYHYNTTNRLLTHRSNAVRIPNIAQSEAAVFRGRRIATDRPSCSFSRQARWALEEEVQCANRCKTRESLLLRWALSLGRPGAAGRARGSSDGAWVVR